MGRKRTGRNSVHIINDFREKVFSHRRKTFKAPARPWGRSVPTGPPGWINLFSPAAGSLGVCTAQGSRAAVCAQGVFCRGS